MRPERLNMQAFGCYLREVSVDFSDLAGTLFLITGSTGGGKTTLLDGMCFALYCRATGGKRTWGDMRSIAAKQETPTVVDFSFQLGAERYRFCRSLKLHVVRGSGRTELRDEHACWRWKEREWELLVSGAESKVRDKAQELLGLSCEQFSQVVVLPQGDFRKLLLANSNEKARIFQTLFQTQRWERISRIAQQMAEENRQELDRLFQNRQLLLNQEQCGDIEELKDKGEQVHQQAKEAKDQWKRLEEQAELLSRESAQARVTAEQYGQLDQYRKERAVLKEREERIKHSKAQWEEGRKIKELLPYYQSLSHAKKELAEQQANLSQAAQRLKTAEGLEREAACRAQEVGRLKREQEHCTKAVGRLEEARKSADKLAWFEEGITKARKALKELEVTRADFAKAKEQAGNNVQAGELFVREVSERVRSLPMEMERLSRLQEMERNYVALARCATEEQTAMNHWKEAQQQEQAARVRQAAMQNKLECLEQALRGNAAVELAGALQRGKPCPVCGSLNHPHPARGGLEDIPEETQQKLLRESAKQGERELLKKAEALAASLATLSLKQTAREAQEAVCKDCSLEREALGPALERAQKLVQQAHRAQEQLHRAEKLLEQRRQEQTDALHSEQLCKDQSHQAATRLAQLESGQKAVRETLPQDFGTAGLLEQQYQSAFKRMGQVQEEIRGLEEGVSKAQKELFQAQEQSRALQRVVQENSQRLEKLSGDYVERCFKCQIAPETPLDQLWIGEQQMQRLERDIREHQDRTALVERRLGELEQALKGVPRPDVKGLEETLMQLRKQAGEASQKAGGLTQSREKLQTVLHSLLEEEKKSAGLEQQYAQTARVAQLLTGGNRRKVPIRMFVLGIMLDDILSRANLYFATFSSGRYRLSRPEQEGGGRGYSGLELKVFDGYSCGIRAVETLSGGELFLASLSLAFGLSDVVQGYSGGVRLDSIFIDEGFGSLDQETLDTAMRALSEVQRSGRTVGIISHVQELKALIPTRIEVLPKGDGGSTVRVLC